MLFEWITVFQHATPPCPCPVPTRLPSLPTGPPPPTSPLFKVGRGRKRAGRKRLRSEPGLPVPRPKHAKKLLSTNHQAFSSPPAMLLLLPSEERRASSPPPSPSIPLAGRHLGILYVSLCFWFLCPSASLQRPKTEGRRGHGGGGGGR